jgi:hypothetical protein
MATTQPIIVSRATFDYLNKAYEETGKSLGEMDCDRRHRMFDRLAKQGSSPRPPHVIGSWPVIFRDKQQSSPRKEIMKSLPVAGIILYIRRVEREEITKRPALAKLYEGCEMKCHGNPAIFRDAEHHEISVPWQITQKQVGLPPTNLSEEVQLREFTAQLDRAIGAALDEIELHVKLVCGTKMKSLQPGLLGFEYDEDVALVDAYYGVLPHLVNRKTLATLRRFSAKLF